MPGYKPRKTPKNRPKKSGRKFATSMEHEQEGRKSPTMKDALEKSKRPVIEKLKELLEKGITDKLVVAEIKTIREAFKEEYLVLSSRVRKEGRESLPPELKERYSILNKAFNI